MEIKKNINNFMKNYLNLFLINQLYYVILIIYISILHFRNKLF